MPRTCPVCGGDCEIADTSNAEDLVMCPECNGTGTVPETHVEKKECSICEETISITVTENDKVMPGQFKGSRENPRHISCDRQRAIERRNEQAHY